MVGIGILVTLNLKAPLRGRPSLGHSSSVRGAASTDGGHIDLGDQRAETVAGIEEYGMVGFDRSPPNYFLHNIHR